MSQRLLRQVGAAPTGRVGRGARRVIVATAALLAACGGTTTPDGPTADVRGTWSYTGTQAVPMLALTGTLVISTQSGRNITGSLTWEEADGVGGNTLRSAQVTGRVVGLMDADFDALSSDATRRHVARISANADTMTGVWVASAIGRNGSFTAVRSAAP